MPKFPHPKLGFYLFVRSGLELRVREGRVRREGAAEGDPERWRYVYWETFHKELEAAVKE